MCNICVYIYIHHTHSVCVYIHTPIRMRIYLFTTAYICVYVHVAHSQLGSFLIGLVSNWAQF